MAADEQTAPPDEAAPDAQAPENADQQDEGGKEGNPLTALVRERQQRREAQGAASDLTRRLDSLERQLTPQQERQDQAWTNPYKREDAPFDWMAAQVEHLESVVGQTEQRTRQSERQQAINGQIESFAQQAVVDIARAAESTPDLRAANEHVERIFATLHGTHARTQLIQALAQGAINGKDAPTVIAELALATGFKSGSRKQDPVTRGMNASKASLGGASASTSTAKPSLKQLATMSRVDARKPENKERLIKALRGEIAR
jgi:hypothetical protein